VSITLETARRSEFRSGAGGKKKQGFVARVWQKKSKVLLRGYARSNALAYGVTSAFKSGFLP
jgi:hypothetical protein